jgi:hypothetical protein
MTKNMKKKLKKMHYIYGNGTPNSWIPQIFWKEQNFEFEIPKSQTCILSRLCLVGIPLPGAKFVSHGVLTPSSSGFYPRNKAYMVF